MDTNNIAKLSGFHLILFILCKNKLLKIQETNHQTKTQKVI
jgi:hypothetical protein